MVVYILSFTVCVCYSILAKGGLAYTVKIRFFKSMKFEIYFRNILDREETRDKPIVLISVAGELDSRIIDFLLFYVE
jgi:hypothetical protein